MTYNVDYFIKKFEAIPEEDFNTGCFVGEYGNMCANGHCGVRNDNVSSENNKEASALNTLFAKIIPPESNRYEDSFWGPVATVNDGQYRRYKQTTPKQRILAALYDIKKLQQPEVTPEKVKTVYVSVPQTITEQTKELVLN